MARQYWFGGLLIGSSLVLLAVSGRLDKAVVLVPAAMLLGYGFVSLPRRKATAP